MENTVNPPPRRFRSFAEFYPFYLSEHSAPGNKVLHFVGTTLAIVCGVAAVFRAEARLLLGCLVLGYGFAWIGHFFVQKNRPATFRHPFYSLAADLKLYFELFTRRRRFGDRSNRLAE